LRMLQQNSVNFVPDSMALPELHVDSTVSQKLFLSVDKINAEDVKKPFTNCHGKLITIKHQQERSGSGKVMATAADNDKQAKLEKEVHEFKDGDNRQRHLYTTALHILYLWELSNLAQLLNKVCQQLSVDCDADKHTPPVVLGKHSSPTRLGQEQRTEKMTEYHSI
jgi:hypothetical protein